MNTDQLRQTIRRIGARGCTKGQHAAALTRIERIVGAAGEVAALIRETGATSPHLTAEERALVAAVEGRA
ncbi:MAG TPA: hypothetical protein VD995_03060 [Azospirillum sp.]|nr:hypothetical protein [Azospirillum sp.]